ncbi:MAG: YbhB/YbcL family Raf kinase inhibitor-like protein [Burkholderiales bacterium]|nr:YbhB/YbcL family Raf kinase inhibitor-like protein [Burkholderiales bacterium]MDQ3196492.1 YbhB/YbcL family Raf kinase inhibitor-like protein [Pseudomonadota bacterium]
MKLTSSSFSDMQKIPDDYAFCVAHPREYAANSNNINPDLAWSDLPAATKSLALICHDPDVPSKPDDVNKEGRTIPANLPRINFYHWLLVDLPADAASIKRGEFSTGVTPRGKSGPRGPRGARQGLNTYTEWFAGDQDMEGNYFGYDGPCPPSNDSIVHHYIFTLYALDVEKCGVSGDFTADDLRKAIAGHVLGEAKLTGLYSLNRQPEDLM